MGRFYSGRALSPNLGITRQERIKTFGISVALIETLSLIFNLLEFDEIECEGGSVCRQPCKAVMKVERFGGRGDGMDDDEARGDFGGRAERAAEHIGKHGPAQPLPLPGEVNRQSPENNRRDGIWHVPAHGADDLLGQNLPYAEGIVADDLP